MIWRGGQLSKRTEHVEESLRRALARCHKKTNGVTHGANGKEQPVISRKSPGGHARRPGQTVKYADETSASGLECSEEHGGAVRVSAATVDETMIIPRLSSFPK